MSKQSMSDAASFTQPTGFLPERIDSTQDSWSSNNAGDDALPPYSLTNEDGSSIIQADGRVSVDVGSRLARTLQRILPDLPEKQELPEYHEEITTEQTSVIPLNIVIQIVGSRGDVQPFIALGNELQKWGHRVRLATHDVFCDFVKKSGLEFYPIGGDPNELMSYMVKNPGLIPSMKTIRAGEIAKKRQMIREMLDGCWKSCIEPDVVRGLPFVADAIIANPPSFAHVHCAQALGVPVHLMFTMPWTATKSFPHPLANIQNSKMEESAANRLSYAVVEWMTWQGLGDVINQWRDTINLEAVAMTEGPFLPYTLTIPMTYCWSGALVPKPSDWGQHIDVCGFFFRDAPDYKPPKELQDFLDAGPKPIYIGFGSIVMENVQKVTTILLEAIRITGVRCILSQGWSGIGNVAGSQNVYLVGDCPHEWLFQQVSAVVHHGGAGTTACGLRYGRPTAIIAFFGDQPFWGDMIASAGAGPRPIHHKELTADNLSVAIAFLLSDEAARAAHAISERMAAENGVSEAVRSFHRNLPQVSLPCDILPHLSAVWTYKAGKRTVKLSKVAAEVLARHLKIDDKKLGLNEVRSYHIENRRWDPYTAASSAAIGTVYDSGIALGAAFKGNGKGKENPDDITALTKPRGGNDVAKNLGKAGGALVKGAVIDIPFALAEGLRCAPAMYGEKLRDHGPITDWKSGGSVAGKQFVYGLYDGISGIVMDPIRGGREEGTIGAVKGVGKGVLGALWKTNGALAGLMGYPLQGVYKSVYTAIHSSTRKSIAKARRKEGAWMLENLTNGELDVKEIITQFDEWKKGKVNV